jgi:putative ABC transport system ATP-binding protein
MNNPPVIIADEPTAHLDSKLSVEFMEIVSQLKDEGRTAIIASHDPLVYGASMVDRVIVIRDGMIEDDET